ncbi:MAG: hypothetical protein U0T82_11225 [Bacteroidales bacterium]
MTNKGTAYKILYLFILWSGVMGIAMLNAGCGHEEGCTDPHARNFDSKADDSCCCRYNGYLLFWHNNTTAGNLYYFSGVSRLIYYLDDRELGSMDVMRFTDQSPTCGDKHAFTATIDLGSEKSRLAKYKIMGNNGQTYWNGDVTIKADTCVKTRLIFK